MCLCRLSAAGLITRLSFSALRLRLHRFLKRAVEARAPLQAHVALTIRELCTTRRVTIHHRLPITSTSNVFQFVEPLQKLQNETGLDENIFAVDLPVAESLELALRKLAQSDKFPGGRVQ
jgi:hypothetical protein